MNRIKARKLFKKIIKVSLVVLVLFYLIFVWYLNTGIDRFIESQAGDLDVEYGQTWVDFSGTLYIHDVKVYGRFDSPLVTIENLQLDFDSIGDLFSLKDYVAYQQLPPSVVINLLNTNTSGDFNLFAQFDRFKIPFSNSLFPEPCVDILTTPPASISFDMQAVLSYQTESREFFFETFLDTIAMADVSLNGRISDIDNYDLGSGFLENVSFNIENFVWLQQALNRCKQESQLEQNNQLAQLFVEKLNRLASDNHYQLSNNLVSQYRSFINLPERLNLVFSPALDQTWEGLQGLPIHEITQKSSISLALNQSEIDELFASVDYVGFAKEQQAKKEDAAPIQTSSFLPVNYQGLKRFVGTQVILHFKNKGQVRGTIERLTPRKLYLSEYKYGGKSELPYDFSEISFIEIGGSR